MAQSAGVAAVAYAQAFQLRAKSAYAQPEQPQGEHVAQLVEKSRYQQGQYLVHVGDEIYKSGQQYCGGAYSEMLSAHR